MRFLKKPWMIFMIGTIVIVGVFLMKDRFTQASPLSKEEIQSQLTAIYHGEIEDLTLSGNTYEANLLKAGAEYSLEANAESGQVLSLQKTKDAPKKIEVSIKPPKEETDPPASDEEDQAGQSDNEDQANKTNETNKKEQSDKAPKEDADKKEEATDKKPVKTEKEPAKKEEKKTEKPTEKESDKKSDKPKKPEDPPKKEPTVIITLEEAAAIALAALPKEMIGEVDEIIFKDSKDGGFYLVEVDIETNDDEDDNDNDEVVYQIHAISGKILSITWDD